jgi:hypothetical protein
MLKKWLLFHARVLSEAILDASLERLPDAMRANPQGVERDTTLLCQCLAVLDLRAFVATIVFDDQLMALSGQTIHALLQTLVHALDIFVSLAQRRR